MTVVARTSRCLCRCHWNDDDTGAAWKWGVDTRDFAAAVIACEPCRPNHVAVLDEPPSRPLPPGDTSTAWNQSDGDGQE